MKGWFRRLLPPACLLLAGGIVSSFPVGRAGAAPLEVLRQPGYGFVYDVPVMAAYQRPYAMNFEIWKPEGLPAGWYATFDGFPVAQVRENHWVYGQVGIDGTLAPTDVLVGSVVPSEVPGLVRVAATWKNQKYFDNPAFRKIMTHRCDHMAMLNEPFMRTVVAWWEREPDIWIWLGDRWKRITPEPGEYTWQALRRNRAWIIEELQKNNIWWLGGESEGVADLARQWGLLWGGSLDMGTLNSYRSENGRSGEGPESGTSSSSTPSNNDNSSRGDWDVGKD